MYKKLVIIILVLITLFGIIWWSKASVAEKASRPSKILSNNQLKIVYAVTNNDVTIVWIAQMPNLAQRFALMRVKHASGYPLKAAISPDETKIAYTLLSLDKVNPSSNGSLWVINIENAIQQKLDDDIDYYVTPRWSPDSTAVVYLKNIILSLNREKYQPELYSIITDGTEKKLLLRDDTALGLYPISYSPNGKLFYYDRITLIGDDLWSVSIASSVQRFIAHVSKGAAWNLSLSPSGKEILGSIIENRSPMSYAVISLSTNGKRHVWTRGAQRHYTPIWGPNAYSITTNIPKGTYPTHSYNYRYQGELKILNQITNTEIPLGFSDEWMNVPISWSPDRKWLVFERYHHSAMDFYIMDYEGTIHQMISPSNWVTFVGWLTSE